MLDVRQNRIQQYDPEFTDLIKNQGLQIRYNGEAGSRTAIYYSTYYAVPIVTKIGTQLSLIQSGNLPYSETVYRGDW